MRWVQHALVSAVVKDRPRRLRRTATVEPYGAVLPAGVTSATAVCCSPCCSYKVAREPSCAIGTSGLCSRMPVVGCPGLCTLGALTEQSFPRIPGRPTMAVPRGGVVRGQGCGGSIAGSLRPQSPYRAQRYSKALEAYLDQSRSDLFCRNWSDGTITVQYSNGSFCSGESLGTIADPQVAVSPCVDRTTPRRTRTSGVTGWSWRTRPLLDTDWLATLRSTGVRGTRLRWWRGLSRRRVRES